MGSYVTSGGGDAVEIIEIVVVEGGMIVSECAVARRVAIEGGG